MSSHHWLQGHELVFQHQQWLLLAIAAAIAVDFKNDDYLERVVSLLNKCTTSLPSAQMFTQTAQ